MQKAVSTILVLVAGVSMASPPAGYYDQAQGKSGHALFEALHGIISHHHVIPYSSSSKLDTSDALRFLDEDPNSPTNVFVWYAQKDEPTNSFGLTTGWNREHRWCNAYGLDSVEPAYSDLFNLHAEDYNVNSSRGDKYYDNSNPLDPGYKNPAHAEAPQCSTDNDSWEPPPSTKGNLARSLFYMATRYTGDVSNEPALHLTDDASTITSTNSNMGKLSTMLQWNQQDPPDDAERLRNDNIYSLYQTNRNPFIDHPEWVNLVFSPPYTNSPRLTLSRINQKTIVTWLATNQSVQLEVSTNLFGNWTSVTNTPVLTNSLFSLTLTNTPAIGFFRLRVD